MPTHAKTARRGGQAQHSAFRYVCVQIASLGLGRRPRLATSQLHQPL